MYIIIFVVFGLALFYLFLIMPTLRHKPGFRELKTVYFAHRGLHDNNPCAEGGCDAPENSLKSFEKAVAAGYGIELDLQLSKDGQVVVFHDETLERMCGVPGNVLDYTYEELKQFTLLGSTERIPLLAETLELVAGQVPLIIEYKIVKHNLSVCEIGDKLLRKYQGVYVIESFHPFALRWYKENHPSVIRGQLADRFTEKEEYKSLQYWLLQNLLLNFITKPDFIAFNFEYAGMWSRTICRRLFRNPAAAWTIKTPAELEKVRQKFDWFIFEGFDIDM
ncbi:MAG: glycerophosphodiester phosphodiesterase [Lachnospiraceae bacterium]|nr:glycerophosphodiester phosphodiesterase [Lachnospiraceae bacterium]